MSGTDLKPLSPARKRDPALWLEAMMGILVALVAMTWMWLFPESASRLGRELHYGIALPLILCVLAAVALQIRRVQYSAYSFALVAGFFLLQLWWLWFSGVSDTMLVGGVLPFSDAADYLANAQLLAGGERIQNLSNDHTLATAMLAVLWKSTHGDYRLIFILISLLGAASAWLAMAEVSLLLGASAGAIWLLADILFFRRFIGVPLSEHLGLILGNLGLALGCRAARSGQGRYWVLASFALALALFARPGAMFTLPALVVGAFLARPQREFRRWILPGAVAFAVLAAFLLNKLVARAVGNQSPDAISNVVYLLHSLVYGGTWTDAMNRFGHDRLGVWHAVEAQLRAHPFSLLTGCKRSLIAFVRQEYLFCFVNARWLNIVLHLAFASGAIAVVLNLRRDMRAWWLFALLAGLLASIPLLPPWVSDDMRPYAATIPLIAFTAAVGIHAAASVLRALGLASNSHGVGFSGGPSSSASQHERPILGRLSMGMLAAVMFLCAFLPPLFRPRTLPSKWSLEDTYRVSSTDGSITYLPGTALRLVPNTLPPSALKLRSDDFRTGLGGFARLYPGEAALLATLPADCVLLPSFHEFSFIAIDESHVPAAGHDPTIKMKVRFIADGCLLLAVDETLIARSAALAAYDSSALGEFSFGINRFPVIRAGDTITLAENVNSIDFSQPPRYGPKINSIRPYTVGSRRLHFPVPGEYYLRINHQYPLKLLVIDRDCKKQDTDRLISDFVESNCIVNPNDGASHLGGQAAIGTVRFFESETPVSTSRSSMLKLIALLQTCASHSSPQ